MQREALESANTNTAVLTTMKNAADALKAAHKNMLVHKYFLISIKFVNDPFYHISGMWITFMI